MWARTGLTFDAALKPILGSRIDTEPEREAASTDRGRGANRTTGLTHSIYTHQTSIPHYPPASPLTRLTTSPLAVFAKIICPVPPTKTSCEFVGFGLILRKLLVGSSTLHFGAPPLRRPPTPLSVNVHTSRSVTRISLTLRPEPCAGNCTLRERESGEQRAETGPEEVPTQRRSEKGSRVSAWGTGLGSSAWGGRERRWRGL